MTKRLDNQGEGDAVIDRIFQHEKCAHLSRADKVQIVEAYRFASDLHDGQIRKNNKPYITHIDESVKLYLNETLEDGEVCNPHNLLVLILHDCIEDCKDGQEQKIIDLYEKFGVYVWRDVLRVSEPSDKVIAMIEGLRDRHPFLYSAAVETNFLAVYDIVKKGDPDEWIQKLAGSPALDISPDMIGCLSSYWHGSLKHEYGQEGDPKKKRKIFGDLIFLAMISSLPRELYRVKATERRNNLQDFEGLLNESGVKSALSTMRTTRDIYIPRALELFLPNIIKRLIQDKLRERIAFVNEGLISLDQL